MMSEFLFQLSESVHFAEESGTYINIACVSKQVCVLLQFSVIFFMDILFACLLACWTFVKCHDFFTK